ncbi:hypothetical protein BLX41_14390 [Pseudomonas protegens]|nr:hypothetical protein BLX41_14390 [Pseudomonas protegens]
MIRGVCHNPVDDPDAYRALIDVAQVAHEERDLRTFEKERPHIESAAFCICPVCHDRFDARDDCSTCAGNGFVTKPVPAVHRSGDLDDGVTGSHMEKPLASAQIGIV